MELVGVFILVIPFAIGYLIGKQAGIKEEYNRKRREWHKWKKRAKAVGVEPLPARRPTPAQRKEWQDQIEQKEKQQIETGTK